VGSGALLRGHPVIEYDGNWQRFQSAMARYEDRHLTVVVLTNLSLCRVQRIVHTVAGFFDPEVAHFKEASDDPRPALTRGFRRLIDDAQEGRLRSEPLSAAARRELSRVCLAALARDLRETGPIERLVFAEKRREARKPDWNASIESTLGRWSTSSRCGI
jgi:hypothetical protein